ncbi:MAG: hypothetical protein WCI03_05440 [bacterium]
MTTLSVFWFLLVIVIAGGISASIFLALRERLRGNSLITHILLALSIMAAGFLLLRPHEDTFTGLDTSCYRLMAHAFMEGRQLHDTDRTLLEIPEPLRRTVLLEYRKWGRDTRDRSFQITSFITGSIQPYFYPFLPMAAVGLDVLSGSLGGDYFVPLMGLLIFALILCTGAALGNKYGLLVGVVLLIGTPLPAYLFRGYYAEAVAAGLVIMVLLGITLSAHSRLFRIFSPLAIGLAVCFHPVAIILALPALIMILIDPSISRKGIFLSLIGFAIGLAPWWAMTVWGCQPYGNFFNFNDFSERLSKEALLRFLGLFVVIFVVGVGTLVLGPTSLKNRITLAVKRILSHPALILILLLLALCPFALPSSIWHGKTLIMSGLAEYWDGVRWGYGSILLAGLLSTFFIKEHPRSRALLLLAVFLSPFFFYLKGFEPMGLWSQRRFIPFTLLLIIALAPPLATACRLFAARAGHIPATLLSGGLLIVGLFNFIQWPAPYLARHEKGATKWVASLSRDIGQRLTFFDYYPYSVPFAASGKMRVIGLSEFGYVAHPKLSQWLTERAGQEEVLWVTAYSNPGLEDGVVFQSLGHQTVSFDRIVSKTALPAECRKYVMDIDILKGVPVTNSAGLVVRKILDDGPLALRGPWGRGSQIQTTNALLPARWSREGSGIIGPIPQVGRSVRITIEAAASRDDGLPRQILKITPPWSGPGLALTISNEFTRVSGILARPDGSPGGSPTGIYKISSEMPYDPGKIGISGYPSDLGARIHLIVIEDTESHL